MISKMLAAASVLMLSIALPATVYAVPAPYTDQAVDQINEAWSYNVDQFNAEVAQLQQGSPEAYFTLGKYMAAAFEGAGYSLDETLLDYLKNAWPSSIPKHMFVQTLQLGTLIIAFEDDVLADALIQSGAVSLGTVSFGRNLSKRFPIESADYVLNGSEPLYDDQPNYRDVGRLRNGQDEWANWIVFVQGELSSGSPIGVVERTGEDLDYWNFVQAIVDQKKFLKVEGAVERLDRGDLIFDDRKDLRILLLK